MASIQLREIGSASPTLAETMRACLLRAGLSRASGSAALVLGSPKAWLGNAYHEVLEKIAEVDLRQETIEVAFDRLWADAIGRQETRAKAHALDQRFGAPASWPGYYVVRASAALRARDLRAGAGQPNAAAGRSEGRAYERMGNLREQEFTAFSGKLRGRPDVVRGREVIDFKSGAIVEQDEVTQTEVVKAAYVRQLRIYGFLVKETLGWWPAKGTLLPLGGPGIEVQLDPTACTTEALEAVAFVDRYNDKLKNASSPDVMASPSPDACRWCPYKLVCQPFWEAASESWSGQLDGGAIEGVLAQAPSVIHAGAAHAIAIDVLAGSEVRQRVNISPLNPTVHPSVSTLASGERVRIVGLRARADGVLVPSSRTVVLRAGDAPSVVLSLEFGQ